ncbi:uncharacterized protein BJ171DRAFT_535100 [Polychytrium aggregatum]|uniref:uncharacterized protein n=1 Tax=Polychytrium aggregatum TaxID=110093 RepID=UPI0022FE6BEB|nr:uncharacterized protein BJ171DRAFT_535100 [Polychytrium aggregatum]KAI9193041.1 hypothetical protein BJ171DRAFT_535100 [Polychytrium aggregatum]
MSWRAPRRMSCSDLTFPSSPMDPALLKQIYELASKPSTPLPTQEWKVFLELRGLIDRLVAAQKDGAKSKTHSPDYAQLVKWLHQHSVDTTAVEIHQTESEGYGLFATQDLEVGAEFLSVPRQVMISVDTASAVLKGYIQRDPILQAIPSLSLALHVLVEALNPKSVYKPYLDTLIDMPFTIPLYWEPRQVEALKGTSVFAEAIKLLKNTARQYVHLYKLIEAAGRSFPIKLRDFTYERFRWSVSVVMTRQNPVPSADGTRTCMALIPLFDLANHRPGEITTFHELNTDCTHSLTLSACAKGDQVYMSYGGRSNQDFLLYSGFVDPSERKNDCIKIWCSIGKDEGDASNRARKQLLERYGLPSAGFYRLKATLSDSPELMALVRVLTMSQVELEEVGQQPPETPTDLSQPVTDRNETAALEWLRNRCRIMLMGLAPVDLAADSPSNDDRIMQLAVAMRTLEREHLESVIAGIDAQGR